MSMGLFRRLAARALGAAETVRPRLPGLFEEGAPTGIAPAQAENLALPVPPPRSARRSEPDAAPVSRRPAEATLPPAAAAARLRAVAPRSSPSDDRSSPEPATAPPQPEPSALSGVPPAPEDASAAGARRSVPNPERSPSPAYALLGPAFPPPQGEAALPPTVPPGADERPGVSLAAMPPVPADTPFARAPSRAREADAPATVSLAPPHADRLSPSPPPPGAVPAAREPGPVGDDRAVEITIGRLEIRVPPRGDGPAPRPPAGPPPLDILIGRRR